MEKEPFYSNGIRWQCLRCSDCCRHESGFVFLSHDDALALANFLNMPIEHFFQTYCRWIALDLQTELLSLKETSNNDCFFWKDGCTVYNARPAQCRTYPFWEGFLTSAETWQKSTSSCPGIGKGKLHSRKYIEECIALEHVPILQRSRVQP